MNARLDLASERPLMTFAAASVASIVTFALLWGVVTLFQSRGEPMAQVAAAERVCVQQIYQSAREACMKEWLARAQTTTVVRR